MRYLLDSNVLSEPIRSIPNPNVLRRIRDNLAEIAVPAPSWHEMLFGCYRLPFSKRRTAIEEYLERGIRSVFPILAYEEAAATWHAVERARLVAAGLTPQFVDGQIASIAHAHGLIVVTNNVQDFAAFEGIQIQNWMVP